MLIVHSKAAICNIFLTSGQMFVCFYYHIVDCAMLDSGINWATLTGHTMRKMKVKAFIFNKKKHKQNIKQS